MDKLNKTTEKIIFYYINRLNGVLGKTHLQKLLFLTDLISIKRTRESITSLEFVKFHYGPYSEEVEKYTELLENKKFIETRTFPYINEKGKQSTYYRYYSQNRDPREIRNLLFSEIGSDKLSILDEIVSSYGNISLQDLLDIVYGYQMIKNAKPMETLLKNAKKVKEEKIDYLF